MNINTKFSKFIANLEQMIIDENQETILLSKTIDLSFGSGLIVTNGELCINSTSACQGSMNGRKCSNSDCSDSTNTKKCTTIQPSTGIL